MKVKKDIEIELEVYEMDKISYDPMGDIRYNLTNKVFSLYNHGEENKSEYIECTDINFNHFFIKRDELIKAVELIKGA